MSRLFARRALSLVSFASLAIAASTSSNATTSHRSLEETVAMLSQQRPTIPLCMGSSQQTDYAYRAKCSGVGEARQLFITGQVVPAAFGQPIGYAQLTSALRAEYRLDAEPDYVFASGYLYVIDHGTRIVRRVIPVEVAR